MSLVFQGDIVNYASPNASGIRPAMILDLYDDGTADLRIFNPYSEGQMDIQRVVQSEDGQPGTFTSGAGAKGRGKLNQPMNAEDNTTVALEDGSDTAALGDYLLIGSEYMKVVDASDKSNLEVE